MGTIFHMSMTAPNGAIPSWEIADRLIKARKVADDGQGITQAELGRRLGVSERTIKRYEAEGANTKRGLVLGWALACGVNAHWLETGQAPRLGPDTDPGEETRGSRCIRGPWGIEPTVEMEKAS